MNELKCKFNILEAKEKLAPYNDNFCTRRENSKQDHPQPNQQYAAPPQAHIPTYVAFIIHSFWSTFVKDLKRNFSCKINKKPHKNSKKVGFFVPTQKCMK
jgi:hypothetical protein